MKEDIFIKFCIENGLIAPKKEFRFKEKRMWRFDYAFPEFFIAIECEGGLWTGGRHTRATGYINDMEKYNEATILGWRVLRYTPKQLCTQATINDIKNIAIII